jgi:two-component system cell cycle response regulator DivK
MARVLIIEDDEKSRRLLSDVLSYHGYEILQTDRGEEGMSMLEDSDVSLVLMDIQLPGISGFEALAKIRASDSLKRTKVVAVTASVMDHDRRRILEAGFDGYVPKPVNLRDLMGTVREMAG